MRHSSRLDALALALVPLLPLQEEDDFGPRETRLPKKEVVIPIDVSTGHVFVDVAIDGRGPFPMLLDTGASGWLLDQDLADELGLPSVGETVAGDPSNPSALRLGLAVLPSVALGDAHFEEIVTATWDRPAAMRSGVERGIVGLPTFEDCLFTLDYAKGELRLARGALPAPTEDPRVVAFHRRDNGLISVPLGLPGGVTVDAHVDSGNQSTVFVPAAFEDELSIVDGSRRTGYGSRASGPVEFVYARLDGDFTIGPLTLRNPDFRLDSAMSHANIGRTLFEAAVVTVDLANERMRIAPRAPDGVHGTDAQARTSQRPAGARRSLGIGVVSQGTELGIARVVAGSPAGVAGIVVGDVLLEVDGEPVSPTDHGPLQRALAGTEPITLVVRRGDETRSFVIPGESNVPKDSSPGPS